MAPTMTDLMPRVEKGAAWLDANRPGWFTRVSLRTLQLEDGCRCVLGQVFGRHYCEVRERVSPDWMAVAAHGFAVYVGPLDSDRDETPQFECDPELLRECWVTAILARRFAASETPMEPAS